MLNGIQQFDFKVTSIFIITDSIRNVSYVFNGENIELMFYWRYSPELTLYNDFRTLKTLFKSFITMLLEYQLLSGEKCNETNFSVFFSLGNPCTCLCRRWWWVVYLWRKSIPNKKYQHLKQFKRHDQTSF